MKVLLLGSHMGYNLEDYAYMNLKKLGHEVIFYGYREKFGKLATPIRMAITRSRVSRDLASLVWLNKVNREIMKISESYEPDMVLSIKGEAVVPKTVEWIKREFGANSVLWYPDDPRYFHSLVRYIAPAYDHVFTASEKAIGMYDEIGCKNVHFLPFAFEETVHKKVNLIDEERRRYGADVVFVGTYTPRRAGLIGALEKAGIKVKVYGPYWKYFKRGGCVHDGVYGPEMVKAFNAAKMVLNVHVEDDLPHKVNMRTFEASGSGAFLLMDSPYGIDEMFSTGEELITYSCEDNLVELAKYYLSTEEERRKISGKSQKRAYKEHTYEQRLTTLITVAGNQN